MFVEQRGPAHCILGCSPKVPMKSVSSALEQPPIHTENLLRGSSPEMAKTVGLLEKIAAAKCNVLITGETGTGKELAALLIHQRSRRRDARLVSLNCAAFPDSLLESELFGYER